MAITNSHTHCFKLDHVPDRFYSLISIRILRNSGILKWLMKKLHRLRHFSNRQVFDRLALMLGIIDKPKQEDIFNILKSSYPAGSRFVVLSMDMEHMGAGKPQQSFRDQLEELAMLKEKYKDIIHPYICADPRNPDITAMVKHYIGERNFTGIKLYPALGYYPFDVRLHDVYRYAIEKNIPVIVHCSKGPVYFRGDYTPDMMIHPVTGIRLEGKNRSELSWNFTDPDNYDYLMDPVKLKPYMDKVMPGVPVSDFSKLKISMGHFGGDKEIKKFLASDWDFDNNVPIVDNNNWFSTIKDLIMKYENFYADISYTWEDDRFNNILKIILEESRFTRDQKLFNRILFGTDFFLVAMETSEKHFSINLRAFLGEQIFWQIAEINPERFLSHLQIMEY